MSDSGPDTPTPPKAEASGPASPTPPSATVDRAAPAAPARRRSRFVRAIAWVWHLPGRMGRNAREIWREHVVLLSIVGLSAAFLVAFLWRDIFIKIGPGQEGVLYRLFFGGTVTDRVWHEGLRIIFPWNTMYIYDVRLQQVSDDFTVLSEDGLAVKVEVSIRFYPERDYVGYVHKYIGPDYVDKFVKPVVQSECRYVFGQYTPEQIYESQGFIIQTVRQAVFARLAARYITLDDLLLKSVVLPPPIALAIETKLRAQQYAQEYDYKLQSATKEAQRKRIEAEGIRSFETISELSPQLFDQYLRFKGIEATLELAQSPNSKIVIIGGGSDRLPIILDGTTRNEVPAAAAAAKAGASPPTRK
jgi:regulator of protease activity HflC (stomatin/prohibitin superfamily)